MLFRASLDGIVSIMLVLFAYGVPENFMFWTSPSEDVNKSESYKYFTVG